MPKKKRGGRSSNSRGGAKKKKDRAAARRERLQGRYLSPGDEDYQQLSQQLRKEGLTLKDVPGDGCVSVCMLEETAEAAIGMWSSVCSSVSGQ